MRSEVARGLLLGCAVCALFLLDVLSFWQTVAVAVAVGFVGGVWRGLWR